MDIADYIDEKLITFLQVEERDEAMETLASLLAKQKRVPNEKAYLEALHKREHIISTGIGMGVAIPHAKLDDVPAFAIAIGIKKEGEGIEWDSLDGSLVRIVFMICGPSKQQGEYLKILSCLTKAIKQEGCRKALASAKSEQEVIELLSKSHFSGIVEDDT